MSQTEESMPLRVLSAEQLSLAFDAVGGGVFDWRIASDEWIRSDAWYQLTGFTRAELAAWEAEHGSIVHPDDRDALGQALQRHVRRQADRYQCEFRIRHKSGAWRWLLGRGLIVQRGPNDEALRMVGTDTDVTARKSAEQALRRAHDDLEQRVKARTAELEGKNQRLKAEMAERAQAQRKLKHSETRLAEAQRIAHIGNWDWNIVDNELHWSDEVYRIFGLTPGEFGATYEAFLERVHPEDRDGVRRAVDAALHEHKPYGIDHRITRSNGAVREVHEQAEVTFNDAEAPTRMFGTVQDITERREAEERQRLTQFAINHSADAIYWVRADAGIGYANDAACQTLGYTRDELTSLLVSQIDPDFPADAWPAHWRKMKEAGSWRFESHHRTKAGRVFPVEIQTSFVRFGGQEYIWAYVRDITERRRLEDQLRQSQKMEAIGLLAGGVAHDFNNILTVILAHCELMRDTLKASSPNFDSLRSDVDQIERSSDRAAALTRQLLTFGHRQMVTPRVLDTNQMLIEMETMLRRLTRADIEFQVVRGSNVATILADAAQIEQVIMNLVVNAVDAIPHNGQITLESANVTLDDEHAGRHAGTRGGPHVMIAVSDTGCGMNEETRRRMFEPFFTTKPIGEGTGLGLATVHGIVKRFDGHITVESEPDRGSTFKVFLPARTEQAADAVVSSDGETAPPGNETVLVCEDNAELRDLACGALRRRGYDVLSAENAAAALKLAGAHRGPLHLLVTDVIMPGLNGRQLAKALCEQREDLRVLYMSGYTDDVITQRGALDEAVELLEKPFSSTDLLSRVRRVLDK